MTAAVDSIGKFHVLGTLGTGAHSTILHIRRVADGKQYALKVVPIGGKEDNKFLEQAKHEFRVAQMLDHPHLIKVFALETARDWLLRPRKLQLLIEYVPGKTLDAFPRLPLKVLLRVFVQVADGLVHMHRRGVYHADLKPHNILLARTGDAKIIDFGLAWIKGEQKDRIQGTPQYMAPEQAKQKIANERTDIYNLGATMYRLVTLRLPPAYMSETPGVLIDAKTAAQQLKPICECAPDVPKELADLIHRCLERVPANRPERVSEVYGELDRLAEKIGQASDPSLEELEW